MKKDSLQAFEIQRFSNGEIKNINDLLSVEEPLGIKIQWREKLYDISVTMRTPGQDEPLAVGFLFTEGIIQSYKEVLNIHNNPEDCLLYTSPSPRDS